MIYEHVTDADKKRISLAMTASSSTWEHFVDLVSQCDSREASEEIEHHLSMLHHMAEAKAGMI